MIISWYINTNYKDLNVPPCQQLAMIKTDEVFNINDIFILNIWHINCNNC